MIYGKSGWGYDQAQRRDGYRFTDFLRLGMVLNVVVWVTTALLVPRFWPF